METQVQSGAVAKSVLIYACAFAIAGATPFLLLPVLTRVLSPQQFGEVTTFLMLAAMTGNIAGLSTHGFVAVRFFKVQAPEFRQIVASSLAAVAAAHVLTALLFVLLHGPLRLVFDLPLGPTLFAVVAAFFLSVNLVFLAIFQSSGQPWLYLAARALQGGVEIFLCLGLLLLFDAGSASRTLSYAAALAASVTLGLWFCIRWRHLGVGANASHLKNLAKFGVPMLPHIVAGTAITYLDRVMVSSLLGVESLGIYMVAMQIGMAMIALIEPLNKALAPWLFAQLAKDDSEVRRMVVRKTYQLYAVLVALGASVLAASLGLFDRLIGAQYAAAKVLIPWMIAGFVLQGMYYTVVNYMFYAERTGRLSVMSSLTAVIGCVVSYTLISALGIVGAGISFALNNAVLFALVWYAASRAVPMPWSAGLQRHEPR